MTSLLLPNQDKIESIDANYIDNNNTIVNERLSIPTTNTLDARHQYSIDEAYAADHGEDVDDEQPMIHSNIAKQNTVIRGKSLTLKILFLTLSLAGLQFTWSVEMAYGTPYLLSLGLSKSHMSLVWIAGPLSGLIMQPIVGAFSDKCTCRFGRRRPFLIVGSIMVVISLLAIGWTREITAVFIQDMKGAAFRKVSIGIAIASIYVLDFSINCVQASCRALIVDSLLPSQQEKGTAWAGRMVGLGNVVGYFMGYVDLVALFPFFGNTQLKALCVFASIILLVCDAITCYTVKENVLIKDRQPSIKVSQFKTFTDIAANLWDLPLPIRRVCNVQFFAWIGWFPFLFYSTTWVAEIYDKMALQQQPTDQGGNADTVGQATRAGSLAFLVYSIVSLMASFVIPLLVISSYNDKYNVNADDQRGSRYSMDFTIRGKRFALSPFKYVQRLQCLSLSRMWTVSHFIFCFAMLSTAFVSSVIAASIVIGLCGISWAVTMWAPFSLLGEYISQCEQEFSVTDQERQLQEQQYRYRRLSELGMQDQHARSSRISVATGTTGMGVSGGIYQLVEEEEREEEEQAQTWQLRIGMDDEIPMQQMSGKSNAHHGHHQRIPGSPRLEQQQQQQSQHRPTIPSNSPTSSSSSAPRLSRLSSDSFSPQHESQERAAEGSDITGTPMTLPSAGIILGIHNMYIVLPQFLVTFFSSILFHFLEKGQHDNNDQQDDTPPSDAIGVVLRFGAVMAAIAGLLSLKLNREK